MILKKLDSFFEQEKRTLLGVGPMSLNCVDATIEVANETNKILTLIASRRQIDSKEFGGGYVNNWDTKNFSNYVTEKDRNSRVIIARDHGGPWQNNVEVDLNLDLENAMESAKRSFATDIRSDIKLIHIDPSIGLGTKPTLEEVFNRLFELYEYCWEYAKKLNKEILFEVGTEEQNGFTNNVEELHYSLNKIKHFCDSKKIKMPYFIVVQTGSKVLEMRNVGSFETSMKNQLLPDSKNSIVELVKICDNFGVKMKAHNCDYFSDQSLKLHPHLGIHAINVAPEFGVVESNALLHIFDKYGFKSLAERFLELSYNSGKWNKWMLANSTATDKDKAIISGHYVFSSPKFKLIYRNASTELRKKNIDLDNYLKLSIKKNILRYIKNLSIEQQS